MATPLKRQPRYYGHFILAHPKAQQSFSYLKNPAILLLQPVFFGPLVSVLMGFH